MSQDDGTGSGGEGPIPGNFLRKPGPQEGIGDQPTMMPRARRSFSRSSKGTVAPVSRMATP